MIFLDILNCAETTNDMKLRIRENSIRLRLTKSEVSEFAEKGSISSETVFSNKSILIYSLRASTSITSPEAEFIGGGINVLVPQKTADQWTSSEEVGISAEKNGLRILIETDLACLNERPGEDESDNFPNPTQNRHNC